MGGVLPSLTAVCTEYGAEARLTTGGPRSMWPPRGTNQNQIRRNLKLDLLKCDALHIRGDSLVQQRLSRGDL